jgi:transposase
MHPDEIREVKRLLAQSLSIRAIARKLGRDAKTIRKALGRRRRDPAPSKLEPYKSRIRDLVGIGLTVPRILREIRELGYKGSRTILSEYVRTLRGPRKNPRRPCRRFETGVAEESQVDWSPFRVPIAGRETRVHCFSMIQAYSRMLFVAFFRNEKLPTLLVAHMEAFGYFGGLSRTLIYDNMATVTLGRVAGKPLWNPAFLEFTRHYGFTPRVCRPKDPDRKGKIERPFPYIESDFLKGNAFESWDDLNRRARRWLDTVANTRTHSTTRRVPFEMHQEEKPFLIALPEVGYCAARSEVRKVAVDGYICVDGSFYPVPASLVGQYVPVRIHPHRLEVLDVHGNVVAGHAIPDLPCRLPAAWEPTDAKGETFSRTALETRFLAYFPEAVAFLEGLLKRMKALTSVHLRLLERLVELYGEERVARAIERATRYRNFNVQAVERILVAEHPDIMPEPPVVPLSGGPAVLGALDDIESGSLETYTLDSMPPTVPAGTDEKPAGEIPDETGEDQAS